VRERGARGEWCGRKPGAWGAEWIVKGGSRFRCLCAWRRVERWFIFSSGREGEDKTGCRQSESGNAKEGRKER